MFVKKMVYSKWWRLKSAEKEHMRIIAVEFSIAVSMLVIGENLRKENY